VEYVKFHTTDLDVYPSFSLCFGDILNEDKLRNIGVNKKDYLEFLKGKVWDASLMNIDYHDVSINLNDYLIAVEMYLENYNGEVEEHNYQLFDKTNPAKTQQWKPNIYQDSNPFLGLIQKCLTVDLPYIQGMQQTWMTLVMNKSVFANVRRPFDRMFSKNPDMLSVEVHYPNQRWRYSKAKRNWDSREPTESDQDDLMNNRSFAMKFYVFSLEVVQKRNTNKNPCNDRSSIDDENLKSSMIKSITCTAPYLTDPQNRTKSDCSTQQQLKEFYKMEIRKHIVPCRRMTQITYLYSEYVSDYYHQKLYNLSHDQDIWYVTLKFPDSRYKEINMLREFNLISLIGNAGGYVGICVGYSLLQFPVLAKRLFYIAKSISFFKKPTSSSATDISILVMPNEDI
jgi:hypothetical protein